MSRVVIEELKLDLIELELLEKQATRPRAKNVLALEIRKIRSEIDSLEPKSKAEILTPRRYEVKLTNYAWDQSPKFVKFYVTVKNVQNLSADNVHCDFTAKSLKLRVNFDNNDHVFTIKDLLSPIDPDGSNWKVKSDMVIINAAKVVDSKWDYVTETEKRSADAKNATKVPDADPSDPTAGIMSLMKNMYDQGDDEMKRTISKAWHDSQSKSQNPTF